jgi:IclR family transcriptional regulator, pca regulon regulatory protein
MAGLAKGLAIIEAFGPDMPRLTVTDAAAAAGLSRATARRCLLTLAEGGYVAYDGKYFRPTPRMLRLGNAYVEAAPLPQMAQPHLVAVRDQVGESASLAVLEEGQALFVARAEVMRIVVTGVRVGASLPAYGSATGHVLLAGLTQDELDRYLEECELKPRTSATLTDVAQVRERVERVRRDGFAYTDEELEYRIRSVAVPVVDSRKRTIAALSVSTSAVPGTTVEEFAERVVPIMRLQAREIGRKI